MKQLPHVSALLYGQPWSILPQHHIELGLLYHSYLHGNLPTPAASAGEREEVCHGVSFQTDRNHGICVITLEGVIAKRAPQMMCGPKTIDLSALDSVLDQVSSDDSIRTLVLDWNTPGGMVIGLEETASRLADLRAIGKRVISYTDYQCCSAGYFLMTESDEIYASPSSVIGSIGTYCAALDDSRSWEMEGLELILAKSGDLKAMGHPGKQWTDEEKAWLQAMADAAGAQFRDQVTRRRGAVPAEAMQGQWFFAKDAHPSLLDGLYRDLPALLADLTI